MSRIRPIIFPILDYVLVAGGILWFAWYAHREGTEFLVAMAGLLLASLAMAWSLFRSSDPLSLVGLRKFNPHTFRLCLQYSAIGIFLALFIRHNTGLSLFPGHLTRVALVTPFIGMTEELVFRGFIQGRLKSGGFFLAVFLAAAGHACYKYLVLRSLPANLGTDLPALALITLVIGMVLGAFREITDTVVPAMIAHAAFDLFLYGDFTNMPAWVWG